MLSKRITTSKGIGIPLLWSSVESTSADIFTVAQIESDLEPTVRGFVVVVMLIPAIGTIRGVRMPLSWVKSSEQYSMGPDPSSTMSYAPYGLEAPFCRAPTALFSWSMEERLIVEPQDLKLQPLKKRGAICFPDVELPREPTPESTILLYKRQLHGRKQGKGEYYLIRALDAANSFIILFSTTIRRVSICSTSFRDFYLFGSLIGCRGH